MLCFTIMQRLYTQWKLFAGAPGNQERHQRNTCTRTPRPPSLEYPVYIRPLQIPIQCNIIFEGLYTRNCNKVSITRLTRTRFLRVYARPLPVPLLTVHALHQPVQYFSASDRTGWVDPVKTSARKRPPTELRVSSFYSARIKKKPFFFPRRIREHFYIHRTVKCST